MNTLVFIQARLGSTRLPGKSLADIAGKPALQWIVERTRRAPGVDGVVVLTTTSPRDAPIRDLAADLDIGCVAGSEDDVLGRFAQGVRNLSPSRVVRVTADCPLVDPQVIGRLLELPEVDHAAIATGAMAERPGLCRYPDGLDAEVVACDALLRADREARDAYEREHVTPFIWRRPDTFRLALLQAPQDLGGERWTIDHAADLEFARAVFDRMANRDLFGMSDVLDLLAREPSLRDINAGERRRSRPVR